MCSHLSLLVHAQPLLAWRNITCQIIFRDNGTYVCNSYAYSEHLVVLCTDRSHLVNFQSSVSIYKGPALMLMSAALPI